MLKLLSEPGRSFAVRGCDALNLMSFVPISTVIEPNLEVTSPSGNLRPAEATHEYVQLPDGKSR